MQPDDRFHGERPARLAALALLAALLATGAGPALAAGDEGFLFGRVTTEGGTTYEGRLRWGDEEAFWGDFFNGTKRDRTIPAEVPANLKRKDPVKIFGITVRWGSSDFEASRVFKSTFGDIREIRVRGRDSATVVMKTGSEFRIDGGSNDLGGEVRIWDDSIGEVVVDWDRIEKIEFLAAPKRLEVDARRLYGTVQTRSGEFSGFVQWDQDECLTEDKLDGDSRDADLSIEFGRIRSIERRSSSSSLVVLQDGRELVLDGSNDVDSSNNGIFVDDERFGRVLIHWDAFERIDFSTPKDSGPAYDSFKPAGPLHGTVTDSRGNKHPGRLVFDLDESEGWEFLDGRARDIEYVIPLSRVASIVPQSRHASRVILRNGEELELEDASDVDVNNDGLLILGTADRETYLPWDEIRRIDFD